MAMTMKSLRYALPALVLAGGALLIPQKSAANPDFTKRTGKKCVYCHIGDWSSGKYTEAGLYYREHATLKGYVEKEQALPASVEASPKASKRQ